MKLNRYNCINDINIYIYTCKPILWDIRILHVAYENTNDVIFLGKISDYMFLDTRTVMTSLLLDIIRTITLVKKKDKLVQKIKILMETIKKIFQGNNIFTLNQYYYKGPEKYPLLGIL